MFTTVSLNQPTLQFGSQGAAVKELQILLNSFFPSSLLSVDGAFGFATQQRVRSFQVRVALSSDGIVGSTTWEALIFELLFLDRSVQLPELSFGMKGDLVRWAQRRLAMSGYYAGVLDGDFGSRTESATKNFQFSRRLAMDGVIGKLTWSALGKVRKP
jgi:peptidoglycan hydrolase-like protein with peptidoglycan-binding domain